MRVFALCLALLAGLLLQAGGDVRAVASVACESTTGLHHHNPDNSHCDHAAGLPGLAGQTAKALPRLQPDHAPLPALRSAALPPALRTVGWAAGPTAVADPPQLALIRVTRLLI